MPNTLVYKLLEACRASGCPVCRLEQQSVERYLDNQFYENVNNPEWRERLRTSLGFCRAHAWLGADQRLGDALGYTIIYHDLINTVLKQSSEDNRSERGVRRWLALFRQVPEQTRTMVEKMLTVITPHKPCPVCEHLEEATRTLLSALVEALKTPEMIEALQASEGLCLPHLAQVLERTRHHAICEQVLAVHRAKLEGLRNELAEFIRKSDYQVIAEGFGKEGDAWLRAIALVTGSRHKM